MAEDEGWRVSDSARRGSWIRAGLFWAGYAAVLVLFGGLVAHRSYAPVWFGRYSRSYALLLVVVLVVVLFWKPFFSFFSGGSVRTRHGRTIRLGAGHKQGWLAFALLVGFAMVEARMRIAHPWVRQADPHLVAQFHPYLQNDLVPGDARLHVNADGFRGDPIPAKGERDVLIFMLGGSTMLSHDVPYEQSHPALLERHLREAYPGVRIVVQNAGNEWHTTLHSLIKYVARIRAHKPDVIVMWHGINDLCRSFGPNRFTQEGVAYRNDYGHYLGPVSGMMQYYRAPVRKPPLFNSLVLSWLRDSLYSDLREAWRAREEQRLESVRVDDFPSLAPFRSNVDMLLKLVAVDGVTVVMASEPTLYAEGLSPEQERSLWMQKSLFRMGTNYPGTVSLAEGMRRFNAASRELAECHKVVFLDLDGAVPKDGRYLFDDCHYTPDGNALVARAVADAVIREKLVEAALARRGRASR